MYEYSSVMQQTRISSGHQLHYLFFPIPPATLHCREHKGSAQGEARNPSLLESWDWSSIYSAMDRMKLTEILFLLSWHYIPSHSPSVQYKDYFSRYSCHVDSFHLVPFNAPIMAQKMQCWQSRELRKWLVISPELNIYSHIYSNIVKPYPMELPLFWCHLMPR